MDHLLCVKLSARGSASNSGPWATAEVSHHPVHLRALSAGISSPAQTIPGICVRAAPCKFGDLFSAYTKHFLFSRIQCSSQQTLKEGTFTIIDPPLQTRQFNIYFHSQASPSKSLSENFLLTGGSQHQGGSPGLGRATRTILDLRVMAMLQVVGY